MNSKKYNQTLNFINSLDERALEGCLTRAQAARIFFELNSHIWELLSKKPKLAAAFILELQPLIIKVREDYEPVRKIQ